ncbi:endolytic transglycosylase MltG [Microbacterium sp. DT81.1]|uniref:endolytic transglycosylase MltG n=1 Tax=Microbacterium sp. DT81.1 TaxID=3393413 RepID=UPI003CF03679
MPDPSSTSDDPFSDLYGKLPDPKEREARVAADERDADGGVAGAADGGDPLGDGRSPAGGGARGPAPDAPVSRRAARLASTTPSATIPAAPSVPASSSVRPDDDPWVGPPTVAMSAVPQARGPQAARASETLGTSAAVAQPTIDELFSAEAHEVHADPPAAKRRRRRGGCLIALVIFALFVGGIVAAGFWVWNTYEDNIREVMGWEEPKDYEEGLATGEAVLTIDSGDGGQAISQSLYEAGVTKTPEAFYSMLIAQPEQPVFYPGVYRLQQKMTSAAALTALQDPASKLENSALLREGLTVEQTLVELSEGIGLPIEDFQAAVTDPAAYGVPADSLEGWLFPAMYTFDPGVTAPQVIQTMVDRTIASLDAAGVPAEQRQEVLIKASIIQREARFQQDFYKVARVIENRLKPDNQETFGLLQMDSTAQYGFDEIDDGTVSTSAEAQFDDNPWNTYVHPGLPIGPIANPGDTAIDAAMHPADGPWLYFVTVNLETGETVFTDNFADHERAIEQWTQWCEDHPDSGC